MKTWKVVFRCEGKKIEKTVEAYTRSDAMNCVCGFVYECEELA